MKSFWLLTLGEDVWKFAKIVPKYVMYGRPLKLALKREDYGYSMNKFQLFMEDSIILPFTFIKKIISLMYVLSFSLREGFVKFFIKS